MKSQLLNSQMSLFDLIGDELNKPIVNKSSVRSFADFSDVDFSCYFDYNFKNYKHDVLIKGLRKTWSEIIYFVLNYENENKFLSVDNFAELYEIGLALQDKQQKKSSGQYYTPDDVAFVMADWFHRQKGVNVCDVACGTGKLIITYLDIIGMEKATDLIRNGRLYLYELDDVALSICKTILLIKYGKDLEPYIHAIHCDFLSKDIVLPKNCKVISNPPYASIDNVAFEWDKTNVAMETKELYSIFMEKIIKQSESSVIITPYSFIGGNKFYSLRLLMNNYNGFIVSFDNVPGNIFCGRKHGVFNTNTSNSVRAAITVVENRHNLNGFKLTPLIRFKNKERKDLLKTDVLETFVNDDYQIVSNDNPMYCKCFKELNVIWKNWINKSDKRLGDYVSQYGSNVLSVPNTCRYYTAASKGLMNRNGQITLNINDENVFNYIFCLINSSFAYWYWRLYDGGISFTKGLLLSMPVFYELLSLDDIRFFNETAEKMIKEASKYTVIKNNVGIQENIKYPKEFRNKINKRLLNILDVDADEKIFDLVHSNTALEVNAQ